MQYFSLKEKVVIVTGGAGILGKTFVRAIAAAKGIPVILGRTEEKCIQLQQELAEEGLEAFAVKADVLNAEELSQAAQSVTGNYGRIDGLVNAAGGNVANAVVQPDADIFEMNVDAMMQAMKLNSIGTVLPTQIFGKIMSKQGFGSVVNISSVSAKNALTRVLGYSMGKAAIDIYTKWMAVEIARRFGDTIRVNSISPGFFLTEQNKSLLTNADGSFTERGALIKQQTPFRRLGQPEELAGALIYLLSDASRFVTGEDIIIDGGFTKFSGV